MQILLLFALHACFNLHHASEHGEGGRAVLKAKTLVSGFVVSAYVKHVNVWYITGRQTKRRRMMISVILPTC